MRWSIQLLLAAVCALNVTAACRFALKPVSVRELPPADYAAARGVAWLDDRYVLIGTRGNGIVKYDLDRGRGQSIVNGAELPKGIPDVEDLSTDGAAIVAFNRDRSDVVFDLKSGTLAHTRRTATMRVMDMDIRGGKVALLGYSFVPGGGGPLWIGAPGAAWPKYKLVFDPTKKHDAFFREAIAPYAGAVRFLDDETIALVSPAQIGVRRYRLDGTALPALGTDMKELAADLLPAIRAAGLDARYNILNERRLIEDLLTLPDHAAGVVVRRWADGRVSWQLWVAVETGATKRVDLAVTDPAATAHARCDARGSRIACCVAGSRLTRLVVFDLRKMEKICA